MKSSSLPPAPEESAGEEAAHIWGSKLGWIAGTDEQGRLLVDFPGNRAGPVDGKRVVIEGEDEIVLQCGQASITLRRNGRVLIRGTVIESHASGTHRIKGGSVQVN